jgi:transposase
MCPELKMKTNGKISAAIIDKWKHRAEKDREDLFRTTYDSSKKKLKGETDHALRLLVSLPAEGKAENTQEIQYIPCTVPVTGKR